MRPGRFWVLGYTHVISITEAHLGIGTSRGVSSPSSSAVLASQILQVYAPLVVFTRPEGYSSANHLARCGVSSGLQPLKAFIELQSHASPPQMLACALAVVVFTVALSTRGGFEMGGDGSASFYLRCEPGAPCRAQTLSFLQSVFGFTARLLLLACYAMGVETPLFEGRCLIVRTCARAWRVCRRVDNMGSAFSKKKKDKNKNAEQAQQNRRLSVAGGANVPHACLDCN
jgi:hypothetical protein